MSVNLMICLKYKNAEEFLKIREKNITSNSSIFLMAKFADVNKKIICSKEDGCMEIYDFGSEKLLLNKKVHNDQILDFDMSPQEEVILTSSKDGKAHVLNTENFEIINTFAPDKPSRNLNSGKISPLFCMEDDNKAKFHAIIAGGQESSKVTTTRANEGGFEILFYNMMYGEEVGSVQGHFGPVNSIAISGTGKAFASGGEDTSVRLHHLSDDYFNLK